MNLIRLNRLIIAVLLSALSVFGIAQNNVKSNRYFANTPNGVAYFDLSTQKILVSFRADVTIERQSEIFSKMKEIKPVNKDTFLPSPKVAMLELQPGLSESQVLNILSSLNEMNEVVYANPFLVYQDGTLQGIQDRFTVKLKSPSGLAKLQVLAKDNGCEIDSKYEHDPLVYFIRVNKNSTGNALEMANKFASTNQFEYAEPDFLLLLKKYNTNDPLLTYQWALNNTGSSIQYNGTPGADMRVFSAWGLSTGNAATKVAIIDEGVDLVHPDLVANMLGGYDGTLQGSGGAPQGDDAHGTACAGIVAASANNNLGVAGIAYNSKIVPVRIAYGSGSSWITSNSWIGTSIDWAWNQGDADVLSNSWGGGSSSSLINDAISRAVTQGRGGLGAVVIFAAGNDNGAVSYPGTLTNVISVAAMSMCNQRKSPSSCDGETWWGSNYGTNVDVAAPGVKIHTTDISGSAGYSSGDYAPTFNGTSSACPNTAGVMALILALNPSLTQAQARQILESTCDKVGGYTYNASVSGQPNGTWSNDLGYGRVNAFAALQLANPVPCTEPPAVATVVATPSSFCTAPTMISLNLTGITFGTGQSYIWESSTDNTNWSIISGATEQSLNISISEATYFKCRVFCESATTSNVTYVSYTDPTITTYPHTQNFDGSSGMPCGWSIQNANNDGYTWSNSTSNPRSAPNAMYYTYTVSNAADDWFFSAPLQMQAGVSYRVNFWYRAQSASYPERMEVKWGNAPNAAGMYPDAIFTNNNIANTTYAAGVTSVMSPAANGIYYVGFHINSLADMYNLMVDDIVIEIAPNCATPNVGGTASGSLTPNVGTSEAYNLTGYTGSNIQWQTAISSAGVFADVVGQTSATGNITFSAAGEYLIRAKVSSDNCTDAYSNVLTVNVVCPSVTVGTATGPATLAGGQTGAFSVDAATGDIFNWQMSIDGGTTFTDIVGTASLNASFALPTGSVQVRFMSRFGTCTPAYSNVLTVNVTSPIGNTLADPINVTLPYTTTMSTASGSGFTSTYTGSSAQSSPDVFFRFTTGPCVDSLRISTCTGTTFDTYLHLLNASGTNITSLDDNGPYCTGTRASMKVAVTPNTVYYVVVEGYSTSTGTFNLEITPIDNPIFSASIDVPGGTLRCEDDPAILIASSGNEYMWSTDETTSFIYALETGVYSVIVENENGCQALASVFIEFLPLQLWYDDLDGDGYGNDNTVIITCYGGNPGQILVGGDCNDANANIYPGATELCNLVDDNCSYTIDEGFDADGDGYTSCGGDCNDNNPNIYPGAVELCNTQDDNCNLLIDEGYDTDGDGFTSCNGDCDDNNPNVYPGATDICANGIDEDCIGGGLGDNAAFDPFFPTEIYMACDENVNGLEVPFLTGGCGDEEVFVESVFVANGCAGAYLRQFLAYSGPQLIATLSQMVYLYDDYAPMIICPPNVTADANPITNTQAVFFVGDATDNCSGDVAITYSHVSGSQFPVGVTSVTMIATDNCGNASSCVFDVTINPATQIWYYQDSDNDGFGNPNAAIFTSNPPAGYITNNGDCDDSNSNINPNAFEFCNLVDDNCNFLIDEGFDTDGDGYTSCNGDCDDNNANIKPGAAEVCDGVDNDCDLAVDEGFDEDLDGYTICNGDCDDNNATVHPNAAEACNGVDDDCDQSIDEGFDLDGDGFTTCNGDCDDNNSNVYPGATDICANGVNEDCVGGGLGDNVSFDPFFPTEIYVACDENILNLEFPFVINGCGDEEVYVEAIAVTGGCAGRYIRNFSAYNGPLLVATTFQIVNLIDEVAPIINCPDNITASANLFTGTAPAVFAASASDNCSEDVILTYSHASGSQFPVGVTTVTVTATDDCGNVAVCTFDVTVNAVLPTWYFDDKDNDGYGDPNTGIFTSNPPVGYITVDGDCNDNNADVNPDAAELCNGYDDNCDTVVDEGCCFLTASASAIDAPCAGVNNGAVNTTVMNAANPVTYLWSNGATTANLSGLAAGIYSVTVIDANGCSAFANATVANLGGTAPAAPTVISGPNGVCRNTTGHVFTVTPVPGAISYQWTLPNGATGSSTTNSITLNFSSSYNTGNLCVRAVNACGMSANYCRSVLAFTSNPSLPGVISGPALNVCAGTTQTYSINPVTNATSYSWTVPSTATIESGQGTTSITVSFGAGFTSSGSIAVRSVNCFGQSSNRTMNVYAKPGIPGTIVGETYGVCGGTTQNYSVPTLAGAASYLWTVPAGAVIVSGQGTNAISVTLPSNFISGAISVAGQSACGSGSVRTKNIFSVPSISGSITGQATGVCSGNYTYSIAVQAGVTSYNWTLPTGCTMVTNNGNSVVINVPSNFVSGSICVSGTNGCGTGAAKCLTISGKPATPASITGPANTCPGQTDLVFSTAQVNNYTYTWTVPASCTITSGQGTNTVTVNWGSATGTIAVRANTPCGTSANRSRSVPVVACLMEPENDSNPFERFEASESALRIYPNPNDGHFMIESDVTGTFVVYNELGQEVKSFTLNSDNLYSQEIEGLTTGFYFIKGINDQEGLVQKIVVTNK